MPPAEFFHLLNPNQAHRAEVAAFFDQQPRSSYAWVERTSHPTHLETLVEWAHREGRHSLAVWGGDGTFSRVIQALVDLNALSEMSVALVARGTCNDFARKAKNAGPIDIGLVEVEGKSRIFMNNSGFGRSAAARHRKPNPIKDILGFTEKQLRVENKKFSAFLGMVCNAPYFSGGLHFAADVRPDDGVLNSFFVSPQNKAKLLLKFIGARLGRPLADAKVVRIDAPRLTVESSEPVFIQADGEWAFAQPAARISFSLLQEKLRFQGIKNGADFRR